MIKVWCVYCNDWHPKDTFDENLQRHYTDYVGDTLVAKTLEEYRSRIEQLGYYEERDL